MAHYANLHHLSFGCYFRFTKEGVLVEGLFWKDVEDLINKYAEETKKSK